MAYSDPYGTQQYPPAQREYDEPFNPYANEQPHRTYDQGGYNYDSGGINAPRYTDDASGYMKERAVVEEVDDAIPNRPVGPKTSRNLRRWRYEHNGDLWTRGGGVRTCGRLLCCTIMIFLFLLVSILLSLALWIRPPTFVVNQFGLSDSATAVTLANDSLTVMFDVTTTVINPNYFSVDLTDLKINLFYPLNNNKTAVGGGEKKDVDFRSHQETNVTFPAQLLYNVTDDPNFSILVDLAKKCGVVPGVASSDVTLDYTAIVSVKVFLIPVKPTISGSTSFACPLSKENIGGLLQSAGINESDLNQLGNILRDLGSSLG